MIEREKDVVEWAMLGSGLDEAREHLDSLIKGMESPDFDEASFGCQLSHIYTHLNQSWNGRDKRGEWTEADFDAFRQYPRDLRPDEGWPSHAETERLLRRADRYLRFRRLWCAIQKPFKRRDDS